MTQGTPQSTSFVFVVKAPPSKESADPVAFKGRSSLEYAEKYVGILRQMIHEAPDEAEGVERIAEWIASLPTQDLTQFYINMHMLSHVVMTASEIVQRVMVMKGMGDHVASRMKSEDLADIEVTIAGGGSYTVLDPARHPDELPRGDNGEDYAIAGAYDSD